MSARDATRKKLFCQEKGQVGSYNRKTTKYRGWNKYLDLHTTRTSILQFSISLLAPIKRGPNLFKHTHGEYWNAKNFPILYCDFGAA